MISVDIRSPLSIGGGFIEGVGNDITSYSQTVSLNGGFSSASISLVISRIKAADWLQNGIARHVVVRYGGVICWEGFVDRVSVTSGSAAASRGPFMDVVNKARVTWQMYTFGGLVPGGQFITDFVEDTESQLGSFIMEGDIAGGTLVSQAEAEAIRDLYLSENSKPKTISEPVESSTGVSLELSCLGYHRLLEKYYYLRAVDATIEATEKIKDVIDADPNSLFGSTKGYFETIGINVNEYEDWSRTGSDIIFELAGLGNSANSRMSFGVYADRAVELKAISSNIAYELSEGFNGAFLTMRGGGPIPLPLVRPGNWMRISNYPLSKLVEGTRGGSSSDVMIETVTFQTPNQLSINGGPFDTFTQRLSRFNFGLA